MQLRTYTAAALILFLLAACANQEEPQVVRYQCESGQVLDVTFDNDTAYFRAGSQDYALPAETLDDYRGGKARLIVRPSGMTVSFGDEVLYWGCQAEDASPFLR